MADKRVQRRLAAVLAADMVEYSRVIGANETDTIARQKVHRIELIATKTIAVSAQQRASSSWERHSRRTPVTQIWKIALILPLVFILFAPAAVGEPAAPAIPGLTVEDPFPRGCVDCHIDRPEEKMDVRISTLMRNWTVQVDTKVLERVRAVTVDRVELSGQHPRLPERSYEDIPASCMECHGGAAKSIPRMGPMLHALHLIGGKENHFLTLFGGDCTHCHKFDADTANWSIPSAPEN